VQPGNTVHTHGVIYFLSIIVGHNLTPVRLAPKQPDDALYNVGHIGLVVTAEREYDELVQPLLAEGERSGEKLIVFGSTALPISRSMLLNSRVPGTGMLRELRHEVNVAWREGYHGVRVVANMHQLGVLPLTAPELLTFELRLDQAVTQLGATMVCAYQSHLFTPKTVAVAMCAHPHGMGINRSDIGFRIWSDGENCWNMAGAIDVDNAATFHMALSSAALGNQRIRLRFTDLRFIDLTGLQTLVDLAGEFPEMILTLEGAPHSFRRWWRMLGYEEMCPQVAVVP
jgi:hypothetical protein